MIGYSLSGCVKDIIEGKVGIDQVDVIIAGTHCKSSRDWEGLVRSYQSMYWASDPEQAVGVLMKLASEGRIIQPRVIGHLPPDISGGHWSKDT